MDEPLRVRRGEGYGACTDAAKNRKLVPTA